ncbi:g6831 [Coccomyxa elongata]
MPAPPGGSEHRHHCQGFSQLEPLKGEWVDHHDPSYMGMTAGKPCPSFINDFDCLHPYTPGPYYEELGRREYRKVFKPHGCALHHFNPEHFEQCLTGRQIIIIGDSTMRQLFQSLACLMTPRIVGGFFMDWDKTNASHISIPFSKEYTLSDEPTTKIFKQNIGNFSLSNGASIHIRSFGIFNISLWDDVFAEFMPLTEKDVILVEFGAWYPRFNSFQMLSPWTRYLNDVQELFSKRLTQTPALVLWRAYGPTHFGGPTGTYTAITEHLPELPGQMICEAAAYGEYYYDTHIMRWLQACGAPCNHIHMLPVYHLSLAQHNSHHGSFGRGTEARRIDCRHYCSNVIDVWNQVLYNKLCFGEIAAMVPAAS